MKKLLLLLLLLPVNSFGQLQCSGGTFGCPTGLTASTLAVINANGLLDSINNNTALSPQFLKIGIGGSADGSVFTQNARIYAPAGTSGQTALSLTTDSRWLILTANDTATTFLGANGSSSIIYPSTGGLAIGTTTAINGSAGSLKAYFDSSGNLGLGAAAPAGYALYLNSGTAGFNGRAYAPNLTTSAANQTDSVCAASTGELVLDTQVGGCIVSTVEVKNILGEITCADARRITQNLKPIRYQYKNIDMPANRADWSEHFGFTAEQVASVEPRLAMFTKEGKPRGVQYELLSAVLTKALQCGNSQGWLRRLF